VRIDALLAAINTPDFTGCSCAGRSELFDPVKRSDPNRDYIEGAAIHLCRSCPMLRECRRWYHSLDPSERPLGVVAGAVQHRTPRRHKPSETPPVVPPMSPMYRAAMKVIADHEARMQARKQAGRR
jgi:hypothetical protein